MPSCLADCAHKHTAPVQMGHPEVPLLPDIPGDDCQVLKQTLAVICP